MNLLLCVLQDFGFEYHGLRKLPSDLFTGMYQLLFILLTGNNLETVENLAISSVWSDEYRFYLDKTGFICDCRIAYMKRMYWPPFVGSDSPCKAPAHLVGVQWQDISADNLTCNGWCIFLLFYIHGIQNY